LWLTACAWLVAAATAAPTALRAQDAAAAVEENQVAAATDYLQSLIDGLRVDLAGGAVVEDWQVQRAPLFNYNDPARGYLAAGVWRIGTSGRPQGIVSLEYWPRNRDKAREQPFVTYEFLVVTGRPFELSAAPDQLTWRADGPAVELLELPDGPEPGESPRQRLTQMRNILRRFEVREIFRNDPITLRLLAQPIDRYEGPADGILDGAAFVFAYGTNPESLVLLECTPDQRWRYGLLRMSWAETVVELDGREVHRFPAVKARPTSGPYQTGERLVAK
jgi:hypothetical protein